MTNPNLKFTLTLKLVLTSQKCHHFCSDLSFFLWLFLIMIIHFTNNNNWIIITSSQKESSIVNISLHSLWNRTDFPFNCSVWPGCWPTASLSTLCSTQRTALKHIWSRQWQITYRNNAVFYWIEDGLCMTRRTYMHTLSSWHLPQSAAFLPHVDLSFNFQYLLLIQYWFFKSRIIWKNLLLLLCEGKRSQRGFSSKMI